MIMQEKETLKAAVSKYGLKQLDKATEELHELLEEIEKYHISREYNEIDLAGFTEELVDVLIMVNQIILLLDVEDAAFNYYALKIHKLQQKIERDSF